jgi:multisubunit Na+/H+ antiporter MnhB subunit
MTVPPAVRVGTVLVYEGVVRPGLAKTGVVVAYILLAVLAPIAIARKMRSSVATWRRTSAVCALVVVAVSVLFFPFAALPMLFSG